MTSQIKKALVTGGAGFIGSHLVDALIDGGCTVTVLDNLTSGRIQNLSAVKDRIRFFQEDIRNVEALSEAMEGCDVVFHEAAVVSVPQTVEDPLGSAAVNETGTLQVLEIARQSGVRRVVLASSSAVYGDDPEIPKRENMSPGPMSPYAVQKLVGEHYAGVYQALYGLETVCLRYFNVYGPRQDPGSPYSGVISIFMDCAKNRQAPSIYGNGEQFRDFVFVGDVVRANLLAAVSNQASGCRINVGTGSHVTVNRLWNKVAEMFGSTILPDFKPPRPGDILESVASIQQAREVLGYQPEISFDWGLKQTCEWHKAQ